jgi:hypothetical protein
MGLFGHRPGKDWERAMATVITAEQTNRAVTVGNDSIMSNTRVVWKVRLRLEPEGRPPIEVEGKTRVAQGNSMWEGMRTAVLFDPDKPSHFEVDDSVDAMIARVTDHTGGAPVGGMDLGALMHQAMDDPSALTQSIASMQQHFQAQAAQVQAQAMAAQPPATNPASGGGIEERLARLGELHSSGVLNDEEFAAAKRNILTEL